MASRGRGARLQAWTRFPHFPGSLETRSRPIAPAVVAVAALQRTRYLLLAGSGCALAGGGESHGRSPSCGRGASAADPTPGSLLPQPRCGGRVPSPPSAARRESLRPPRTATTGMRTRSNRTALQLQVSDRRGPAGVAWARATG